MGLGLIFLVCCACDFSSKLNERILVAQKQIQDHHYNEAAIQYEEIVRMNPPLPVREKAHYQLGELYSLYLSQYTKAIAHYEELMSVSDNPLWQIKAMDRIGEVAFSFLKDYSKATTSYRKLVDYAPVLERRPFYLFRLGQSLAESGRADEAISVLEKISQDHANPYYVDAYHEMGRIYFQQKNWSKAIRAWMEELKRENRNEKIVQTKFLIANAYETMENLKDAYDIYYSILGDYPNTDVIKNRLKSLYHRRVARKR